MKWVGGKRTLIPEIARRLPKAIIRTYWEPFIGGGAVFFELEGKIATAQLSDINAELVLTYQVVQNNPEPLISLLAQHACNHDKLYYMRVRKLVEIPSSIELAARFIYLNKTCFNGLYRVNKSGQFNAAMGSYKNPAICDAENLRAASKALGKANIRIGDFSEINPSGGDFIYADPPYDGTFAGYYAHGFEQSDHMRLRDAAVSWHKTGAAVMLANADTDLVRSLYGKPPFVLHEVSAPRSVNCNGSGRGAVGELLITTYDYQPRLGGFL